MISAKRVGRLTLTILAVASLGACARSVPSPETPRPETPLVVYREFQENGSTRTIRANHEEQGTFDINSVVEVRVNEEELSAAVRTGALPPAPDVTDLLTLIGRLAAHLITLRNLSLSVAGMLQAGELPVVEAALVKDLGTNFEREMPGLIRAIRPAEVALDADDPFERTMARALLYAPAVTIQGGTREILRGVIARGLGLR